MVLGDASPGERVALREFAASIAGRIDRFATVTAVVAEIAGPEALADVGTAVSAGGLVELVPEQVGGVEPVRSTNFILPGYLTMFIFFAAALSAEAIVRERRNHTLERLMSNGTRREAILAGKFLTALYRGLMQLAVLWIVGIFAFDIDFGVSPAAVILVSVLMVIASSAFGIMLASMVRTQNAASSAGVLVSLTLAPLGGCW